MRSSKRLRKPLKLPMNPLKLLLVRKRKEAIRRKAETKRKVATRKKAAIKRKEAIRKKAETKSPTLSLLVMLKLLPRLQLVEPLLLPLQPPHQHLLLHLRQLLLLHLRLLLHLLPLQLPHQHLLLPQPPHLRQLQPLLPSEACLYRVWLQHEP